MAPISHSLSYKVCSITLPKFNTFGLFILILCTSAIIDQTACCYNVTTSETGLYLFCPPNYFSSSYVAPEPRFQTYTRTREIVYFPNSDYWNQFLFSVDMSLISLPRAGLRTVADPEILVRRDLIIKGGGDIISAQKFRQLGVLSVVFCHISAGLSP